ncbi:type A von willebrand factor domain protein (macronuclear) [Tetrahymena thermophila SB210]|uniref:Type A von willebrand factor domain protein n=1 Tax=Tetrahymena thermophila (strain SB210) TaxID=312017 RepID=Q233Q0_TETTS|nr:type A von willebrand factor domain protein [Tetrahymena thermophila SB210]EAR91779.1 type A von willebrand factor domain protein [Tetrahymena thermophila SB210]|eukprot:XP_001012024.1 type A von willebrand factor domain protein [Tetrahymena thermophila SB210]
MKQNKQFSLHTLEYCKSVQNKYQSAQTPATLKSVQYKCQIINNILKTTLTQTFVSYSSSENSETIYYFPIINGTCLELFEAKYNDKTIKGIIKEKSVAKKEYQENKNQGNFVSYAKTSTEDDQLFCEILLGNLPPNQQVEIHLIFSQQLSSILNKYFVATIPLQYCEDNISAKLGINLLTLDLFCTGKITYAESRGQKTEKVIVDDNTVKFNLSQALNQKGNELQFVFSFEGMFEPQIIFGSSRIFHEDYVKRAILPVSNSVMVSFIPNFNEEITKEVDDAVKAALNKGEDVICEEFQQKISSELVDHLNSSKSEFIFLLDRSGSMSGQSIKQACEALVLFLQSLPIDSYFNVVSFGSSFEKLFPSSQKYNSQNLEQAVQIINQYSANLGGTEIYQPLHNVFNEKKIEGYNKQIFLLTDGQVDNPKQVVNLIKKNNKFSRIHSIGFGNDADKQLIQETAVYGKGISKIVNQNCDLQEVVIEMLSLSITPTLDQFKMIYDQNIFESTYPSSTNFPCIFKDEIINIHLFFKPLVQISELTQEQKQIEIEYYDSCQKQKVQKKLIMQMQDSFSCNSELQQSVFKIGKQLQLNEMIEEQEQEYNDKILQQSIDYQLLTQNTALICVIETLNDEQKVIFENLKHSPFHQQLNQIQSIEKESMQIQQNIAYNYQSSSYAAAATPAQKSQYKLEVEEDDFEGDDLFGCDFGIVGSYSSSNYSINQSSQQQQVLENESNFSQIKNQSNQNIQDLIKNSKPNLQNLLNLVDSEGVWKYDDILIKQCCSKIDSAQIKKYCSNFITQNAFMTLLVIIFLEIEYSQQKNKWKLISKKSNNFIQSQIKAGIDLNSLKETIKKLIIS